MYLRHFHGLLLASALALGIVDARGHGSMVPTVRPPSINVPHVRPPTIVPNTSSIIQGNVNSARGSAGGSGNNGGSNSNSSGRSGNTAGNSNGNSNSNSNSNNNSNSVGDGNKAAVDDSNPPTNDHADAGPNLVPPQPYETPKPVSDSTTTASSEPVSPPTLVPPQPYEAPKPVTDSATTTASSEPVSPPTLVPPQPVTEPNSVTDPTTIASSEPPPADKTTVSSTEPAAPPHDSTEKPIQTANSNANEQPINTSNSNTSGPASSGDSANNSGGNTNVPGDGTTHSNTAANSNTPIYPTSPMTPEEAAVLKGLGALGEIVAGGTYVANTGGIGAFVGGSTLIAHGFDQLNAALTQYITGVEIDTKTSKKLQEMGMSRGAANIAEGLVAGAGSFYASAAGQLAAKGSVQVSSWASPGIKPDFAPGRWVQVGEATPFNFLKTGLPGPKGDWAPFPKIITIKPSNVPLSNSATTSVPASTLQWPPGREVWKGTLGQRVIQPAGSTAAASTPLISPATAGAAAAAGGAAAK